MLWAKSIDTSYYKVIPLKTSAWGLSERRVRVEDLPSLTSSRLYKGISLDLDKFLTLKEANKFAFSSLNRNFTLSLQQWFIIFDCSVRCNGWRTSLSLHRYSSAITCWSQNSSGPHWWCLPRFVLFRAVSTVSMIYGMLRQIVCIRRNVIVR